MMKQIIMSLFFLGAISGQLHTALVKGFKDVNYYAPPQEVSAFLDEICNRYAIQPNVIQNAALLEQKLQAAGFTFLRVSLEFNKMIVQLPAPYDNYLLKINCASYSGQRNCSRVFVAEKIRNIIQCKHFKHLYAPKKYLYKLPMASDQLCDSNYLVLVEKVALEKEKLLFSMPPKALQELYYVIKKVLYFDHGYYVKVGKKIIVYDFNICLDAQGRIVFVDTEDGNVLGNLNSIELGNDISTITHVLEHSGCKGQAPKEALLAHVIIREGQRKNDLKLVQYGKSILRKLYTIYCGFFPFVVMKGDAAFSVVQDIAHEVEALSNKIVKNNTPIRQHYWQALAAYKNGNTPNFQKRLSDVVAVWRHKYASKGQEFCLVHKSQVTQVLLDKHAPPPGLRIFLDNLCYRYHLSVEDTHDAERLTAKLIKGGFSIIRAAGQKIIAQLPAPYDTFLIKINCDEIAGAKNCGRVFLAEEIQRIIDKYHFTGLRVPKKYLYKVPGASNQIMGRNYFVIVEKIALDNNRLIFNMPQQILAQLYHVMTQVCFFDHGYRLDFNKKIITLDTNLSVDVQGRIVFLDTEDADILKDIGSMMAGSEVGIFLGILHHSGCLDEAPQEVILAYTLISQGKILNNKKLIVLGKKLLRKMYTAYCGLFPFLVLQGQNVIPFMQQLAQDVTGLRKKILRAYPHLRELYHAHLNGFRYYFPKDFHNSFQVIVKQLWEPSRAIAPNSFRFVWKCW